uniref:YEATS domain-containing protein n=1 Tax=Mantoniella antarctica TaxID=81844 RepID=A0A7S0X5H8_9CHLO|mmetsp:Transcript_20444/g.50817  ORF Transcript_20444/g.50817 Transcript_20444/m.50817 type:complete len:236 (+) Transcript_20444:244-951(+)
MVDTASADTDAAATPAGAAKVAAAAAGEVAAEVDAPGRKRMRDTELVVPMCYGTCAYWLGKKADEYHSHKWTVYLRGPEHEDLSHAIQKVVFNLHPSFKEPVRVLDAPPYEVTETGWGEFEIGITVHFVPDAGEKPLDLFAPLKLYADADALEKKPQQKNKPVVKEKYEEVVFHEPREVFHARLAAHTHRAAPESELTPVLSKRDDRDELLKIVTARKVVAERIGVLKQQLDALT